MTVQKLFSILGGYQKRFDTTMPVCSRRVKQELPTPKYKFKARIGNLLQLHH